MPSLSTYQKIARRLWLAFQPKGGAGYKQLIDAGKKEGPEVLSIIRGLIKKGRGDAALIGKNIKSIPRRARAARKNVKEGIEDRKDARAEFDMDQATYNELPEELYDMDRMKLLTEFQLKRKALLKSIRDSASEGKSRVEDLVKSIRNP